MLTPDFYLMFPNQPRLRAEYDRVIAALGTTGRNLARSAGGVNQTSVSVP